MQIQPAFQPSRILCPVDFSDLSDLALKYAAAGAQAYGAELVVLHAEAFDLPPYFTPGQMKDLDQQIQTARKQIQEFLRQHTRKILGRSLDKLTVKFKVVEGHPVDVILAAAEKSAADLLVLGTHGRGAAQRLWLGSVTENVARRATMPVFVVRQKQHDFIDAADPKHRPEIQTVLCPVNLTEAARVSCQTAAAIAGQFGARLVTLCVTENGPVKGHPETQTTLPSWLSELPESSCLVETLTRRGHPAETIIQVARQAKADLIVLGAQWRATAGTWLWGTTTEVVLRQAPAPVLVVPRREG